MYELNPEEIDLGSSLRKVRAFQGSSYPESTVCTDRVGVAVYSDACLQIARPRLAARNAKSSSDLTKKEGTVNF